MRGTVIGAIALVLVGLSATSGPAEAEDGPTFRISDLIGTGCQSDQVAFHTVASGMPEHEGYAVRTRAVAGGLTYTDELADVEGAGMDETFCWSLLDFNNYPGAPAANRGTWPLPEDQPVVVTLTLEKPMGVVVDSWTSVLSKCNGGVFTQNGPSDPGPGHGRRRCAARPRCPPDHARPHSGRMPDACPDAHRDALGTGRWDTGLRSRPWDVCQRQDPGLAGREGRGRRQGRGGPHLSYRHLPASWACAGVLLRHHPASGAADRGHPGQVPIGQPEGPVTLQLTRRWWERRGCH